MIRTLAAALTLATLTLSAAHAENVCLAPPPGAAEIEVTYCEPPGDPFIEWAGFATSETELCTFGFDLCGPVEWYPGYGPVGLSLTPTPSWPWDHVGPLNEAVNEVYVWLLCTPVGIDISELRFSIAGNAEVLDFVPYPFAEDVGTFPEVHLVFSDCIGGGGSLLGKLLVLGSATATPEPTEATWGEVKAEYVDGVD
jgi:hypothetical protein